MNSEQRSGVERQLAAAQGDLSTARDDLDLANDRIKTLTDAVRTHLAGLRDVESFEALHCALHAAPAADAPETSRYSVQKYGSLGAAIIAERNDLRTALRTIQEWDCLNPPRADLLGDLPWLKRVVDAALQPDNSDRGAEVLTDEQIWAKCAEVWKAANTWNLSYEDFLKHSYQRGADGKGPINGSANQPGDTVYTTPEGHELTRAMAQHWCQHWHAYSYGFVTAWKLCSQANGEMAGT
jgi:hypothetical protein